MAHIAGTASNSDFGDTWCFELLWRVEDCMDPTAYNYNVYAILESGCCVYELTNLPGCTDVHALNFMELATVEDGSCIYLGVPYLDSDGNCLHDDDDDGICNELELAGCTSSNALNYQPWATEDDGSCIHEGTTGCTYATALNFDPDAMQDDGSCAFETIPNPCPADLDLDGTVAISDLLIILASFGEACD